MMNADNGRFTSLQPHIAQSVRNILFTRIGTRLMREEYGSLLPELMDMPLTPATLMMCQAATVSAIARWEPRLDIKNVSVEPVPADGRLKISLYAAVAGGAAEKFEITL